MNCAQIKEFIPAYLDDEINPSERRLIQAHLAKCNACQRDLALLSQTRNLVSQSLNIRAADAAPSPQALIRLQARLADEALRPHHRFIAWLSRLAQDASRASTQVFGDLTMRKRWTFSALAAILVISAVTVFSVTSVSASEILDRASAAQSAAFSSKGIQHIKFESYFLKDLAESTGVKTIFDSYGDLQTGNFWNVTFDANGAVLDVSAYDGTYTYSQDYAVERVSGNPLTIYRTPQHAADLKPAGSGDGMDEKALFEQMRKDPNVKLVGKEAWGDGRKVYVLQSHQQVKAILNGQVEQPEGLVTIYFDTSTYKQVGYRITMQKDGVEILLMSEKVLVDEILPAGSSLPWNVESLPGVVVVDDSNREHSDLLPESITSEELAAKTTSGYLLRTIPDGFTLELTAPPKQPEGELYIYIASYRNAANDYFVIQSGVGLPSVTSDATITCTVASGVKVCNTEQASVTDTPVEETYTTASGLVMHFMNMQIPEHPADSKMIEAIVEAPDGTTFMVTSTLPMETIKALTEDLAPMR